MGNDRCLFKFDCFGWTGRAGVMVFVRGRRTGRLYFLIVAIAAAVDADEFSRGNEGFRRLIGPGRFSTSHDEADR
jgi:hypothetical protein